jgi:hypothetical protein
MVDLQDLEAKLAPLSHSAEAIEVIRTACKSLPNTSERIALWSAKNAIVCEPIQPEYVRELGFDNPEDEFVLLQGDIVRTDSAYFMGERITGHAKYAVLNSSCDLVPNRSSYSLLLKIAEITRGDPQVNAKLGQLVKFSRNDSMYIPALPDDPEDVVGNEVHFDGVCQILHQHLLLANRIASLSLIGWRIFGAFARNVIARANPREVEIRTAVQK